MSVTSRRTGATALRLVLALIMATAGGLALPAGAARADDPQPADLSVAAVGPALIVPGHPVEYTITVRNAGPSAAEAVMITGVLPAGIGFTGGSGRGGECSEDKGEGPSTVRCPVGELAVGARQEIVITATSDPGLEDGTITNRVTVTSDTPDGRPGNNTARAESFVKGDANLSITKEATSEEFIAGAEGGYRVTVTNHGPSIARSVRVDDPLPEGLTPTGAVTANGTCAIEDRTVSCRLGDLAPEVSAQVLIKVRVGSTVTTPVQNIATVSSPTDRISRRAQVTTPVRSAAELSLTKTFDGTEAVPGGEVTFRLIATNRGRATATEVVITDPLPTGLTPTGVSSPDGGCSYDGDVLSCAAGDLPSGESAEFTITSTLDPQYQGTELINRATVHSAVRDQDQDDDTATAKIAVQQRADLQLEKGTNATAAVPGETVNYLILLVNHGPAVARDVVVTDRLPDGLVGVRAEIRGGEPCTIDDGQVRCAVGDQPIGQVVIELEARLDPAVTRPELINTAVVDSETPDADPGDESATSTVPVTPVADLGLIKAMAPAGPVHPGQDVAYRLEVTNSGPSVARQVRVVDRLPEGLINPLVRTTAGFDCQVTETMIDCLVESLAPGARRVIGITAKVGPTATGAITNTATIFSDVPDRDDGNNQSSVTAEVSAEPEPSTDPDADASSDADPSAEAEASSDPESSAEADASSDPGSSTDPDADASSDADPSVDAEGSSDPDASADADPTPDASADAHPTPDADPTPGPSKPGPSSPPSPNPDPSPADPIPPRPGTTDPTPVPGCRPLPPTPTRRIPRPRRPATTTGLRPTGCPIPAPTWAFGCH